MCIIYGKRKEGNGIRQVNCTTIKDRKWDSGILSLTAAIYKEAGKQELAPKQRPEELEKLIEIAKIQNTEASDDTKGIDYGLILCNYANYRVTA